MMMSLRVVLIPPLGAAAVVLLMISSVEENHDINKELRYQISERFEDNLCTTWSLYTVPMCPLTIQPLYKGQQSMPTIIIFRQPLSTKENRAHPNNYCQTQM